jgi:hypothetical protein
MLKAERALEAPVLLSAASLQLQVGSFIHNNTQVIHRLIVSAAEMLPRMMVSVPLPRGIRQCHVSP